MRTIVFPNIDVAVGAPPVVKLTDKEAKALALVHLGGIEAMRTETHKVTCKTVDSLVRKGYLESLADCTLPDGSVRRGGLTWIGKRVAEACAEAELSALTK